MGTTFKKFKVGVSKREIPFAFDFNAICDYEEDIGESFFEQDQNPTATKASKLYYYMYKSGCDQAGETANLDLRSFRKLIGFDNELMEKLNKFIEDNNPKKEEDEETEDTEKKNLASID